jgi:hypothetical protein
MARSAGQRVVGVSKKDPTNWLGKFLRVAFVQNPEFSFQMAIMLGNIE